MIYLPSLLDLDIKYCVPMDKETSEIYIKCSILETRDPQEFTEQHAAQMGMIGKILFPRLKIFGAKCTLAVALAVCHISAGSPGNVVLYAFTLGRLFKQNNKIVDMMALSNAFPIGFPNEAGLQAVWETQKGHHWELDCDNLLDRPNLVSDVENLEHKANWKL